MALWFPACTALDCRAADALTWDDMFTQGRGNGVGMWHKRVDGSQMLTGAHGSTCGWLTVSRDGGSTVCPRAARAPAGHPSGTRAGSADTVARVRRSGRHPETIPEVPEALDDAHSPEQVSDQASQGTLERGGRAAAGAVVASRPQRRPVSAAEVRRSAYDTLHAQPGGPAGCKLRAQSACTPLHGQPAARCPSGGRGMSAGGGAQRGGGERAHGVLTWGSARSAPLVTEVWRRWQG